MARAAKTVGRLELWAGVVLLVLGVAGRGEAMLPDGYNHPELRWSMLESEHFRVIFHQGSEELAQRCAAIGEKFYGQVTGDLGAEPKEKTPILLGDYSDEATAFAVREQKVIYISAPALNEARINGEEYLRALIVHEFTHIVTYWAVRGPYWDIGEWTGAAFMPEWFVEGLAQAEAYTFNAYGGFLILRSATLEGTLSRLADVDVGPPTDLIDTWLTYAQGQSMVSYIAQEYGKEKLAEILRSYSRWRVFDLTIRKNLGISENALYRRWRAAVVQKYEELKGDERNLKTLKLPIRAAVSARFSPDGKRLAFVGVKDWEETGPLLYVADADGSNMRAIAGDLGIFTSVKLTWSPDGSKIYYSAKRRTRTGAYRSGIYSIGADGTGGRLLSRELRAEDAAVSPLGDRIAFISYRGDAAVLATMNVSGEDVRYLTPADAGYECFAPAWSPDGKAIVFASVFGPYSAIAAVDADGSNYRQLTSGARFDVDPQFSPDGTRIAFVSYYTGVPNVCTMAADGTDGARLTDLKLVSAFYPSWSPDGKQVLFSAFETRDVMLELVGAEERVEELPTRELPAGAGEKTAAASAYPISPYRPLREFRRFITRTMNTGDGRGNTLGLLTEFADPLRKHTLSAYTEYGTDSHRPFLDFRYTNSTLFPIITGEVFSRVDPARAEAGQLVWDEERGLALGVTYPRNPGGRLFKRDTTTVSLGASHRRPFEATVSPLPSGGGGTLNTASLIWRRADLSPSKVLKNYSLGYVNGGHLLGGDFEFTDAFVSAEHQWRVPNVRHLAIASLRYDDYDGETFSHDPVRFQVASSRLGYRLRVGDDVSTSFWPLVYVARSYAELAWAHQELLTGSGLPEGDFLSLHLVNTGHLTRFGPFEATMGADWNAKTGDTNVFFRLNIEPLAVPLRQEPAPEGLAMPGAGVVNQAAASDVPPVEPGVASYLALPWAFNQRVSVR